MANGKEILAPINRLPMGLLGFLGIKAGGRYPRDLSDTLSPVLDLFQHYIAINSEEYALTTTQLAPGAYDIQQMEWTNSTPADITGGANVTVPSAELWYVQLYNVRIQFNAVAGSEADVGPEVVPTTGSHRYGGPVQGFTTSAATYARGMCRAWIGGGGFWAKPGSRIAIRRYGALIAAGGTGDISGTIRFARFPL